LRKRPTGRKTPSKKFYNWGTKPIEGEGEKAGEKPKNKKRDEAFGRGGTSILLGKTERTYRI